MVVRRVIVSTMLVPLQGLRFGIEDESLAATRYSDPNGL